MDDYIIWAEEVLKKVRNKLSWVCDKNKQKIPYTTRPDGSYDDRSDDSKEWPVDDGLSWWTNGFWGGLLWLMYQDTHEKKYLDYARLSMKKLEATFTSFYGLHHDIGFMFQPTAVADYRITGNQDARRVALIAANLLAGRFNLRGNYFRAWNDFSTDDTRGWVIIDSMFNISLLYWASLETGDPRFRHMAISHSDTIVKNFIRPDGSVKHIVEIDPETGEYVRDYGGQGFGRGSAWSRGQGWALYGLVNSYTNSGEERYLRAARQVADFILGHIPQSGLIPIDFFQPADPAWEDACGGAIIAGGLLELSTAIGDSLSCPYHDAAIKILLMLDTERADWSDKCDAIIQNCSSRYHGDEHHINMVYADYFFVEALHKITGIGRLLW